MPSSGRDREAARILKANKAVAVVRLMGGLLKDWHEFFEPSTADLQSLPRRNLKSGHADVKKRLSKELDKFCNKNFLNMTEDSLAKLYDDVSGHRGLEMPLLKFEEKYAAILPRRRADIPRHSTVVISLWGLQYQYPEDELAKDLREAIIVATSSSAKLEKLKKISHAEALKKKDEVARLVSKENFSSRSAILCCFNLIEAYLNGLAWKFSQDDSNLSALSQKKRNLILDTGKTTLRAKIIKYPEIISGTALWTENDEPVKSFLEIFKPFRDSLVHPSPFDAPEKFGGYDKLRKIYDVKKGTAVEIVRTATRMILDINMHLIGQDVPPIWLKEIINEVRE